MLKVCTCVLYVLADTPMQVKHRPASLCIIVHFTAYCWVYSTPNKMMSHTTPGCEVIKLFSCSTQLSTQFQLLIKLKYLQMKKFLALSLSDVVFIMLINIKIPTIVGILTFISRINFVLSWVEHGKSFITLGPGLRRYMRSLIMIV